MKARDFCRAGGVVIAFGVLPRASERAGSDDPELAKLVREVFGPDAGGSSLTTHRHESGGLGWFIPDGYSCVESAVNQSIERDFLARDSGLTVLHRREESCNIYYVFNPHAEAVDTEVTFRATGSVRRWEPWTGRTIAVTGAESCGQRTRVPMMLGPAEAQVVVFEREATSTDISTGSLSLCQVGNTSNTLGEQIFAVDGLWDFDLQPTMDNRFGDFRLPAHEGLLGADARRFRFAEEPVSDPAPSWHVPDMDDSAWPLVTYSFGPRFWKLGPITPGANLAAIEQNLTSLSRIDPTLPIVVDGREFFWRSYEMSLRWGIENDPCMMDWASGPHGLKGKVPDEFIDLHDDRPGATWYLWTSVQSTIAGTAALTMGSRSVYVAWFGRRAVLEQVDALPAGRQSIWNLPHYHSEPRRANVELSAGDNPLLLRFTQPADQRVRAYVAFDSATITNEVDDEPSEPALRWFIRRDHPVLNYRPGQPMRAGWYRFTAPPGLSAMTITARGPIHAWSAGSKLPAGMSSRRGNGALTYRLTVPKPSLDPVIVAIRVEAPPDSFAGDCVPEPILLECGPGRIPLGDWSAFGLATYSGVARYSRTIEVNSQQVVETVVLDLGAIAATAAVRVNGELVATLITPPWRVDLTGHLRAGSNRIEIEVANTLANHYSVGIPTPYVFPGQTISGLLGPVRWIVRSSNPLIEGFQT